MSTILLSFVIVIALVNLALALSTFGYIVEMNKHMEEWFRMFKTLTEACSGLCEENGHIITSLMKHIEYTGKGFTEKEKEVQELNDKYDKLYEEFKKLEEKLDKDTYHYIKDALSNDFTKEDYYKQLIKPPFLISDTTHPYMFQVHLEEPKYELENVKEEDIGGQNGNSNNA